MAAAACLVGGVGNGIAVVCNALLVQRGIVDELRGRALTFVMSATFGLTGIGTIVAGAFMPADGARCGCGAAGVAAPSVRCARRDGGSHTCRGRRDL